MTDRIQTMRTFFVTDRAHHAHRRPAGDERCLAVNFAKEGLSDVRRASLRLQHVLETETPVVFPWERIAFLRTIRTIPAIFTAEEEEQLKAEHRLHERGDVSNICVDYSIFLRAGLPGMLDKVRRQREEFLQKGAEEQAAYLHEQEEILLAVQNLTERYRQEAQRVGNTVVEETLGALLSRAPQTLLEAMQLQRIIHFTMWCGNNYHNTLGRFDQYMRPYLEHDLQAGILDEESALELVEEYFLSFNRDSDLYPGMQQGDNGQSLVLGGKNADGSDGFSLLSRLCLQASLELRLIDPKINVRVSKDTPLSVYQLGTELTKQGLGFPQYSNDDVVIPGLIRLGYKPEDACQYAVAACWEFIIPGRGMDVVNIDALPFASLTRKAIVDHLSDSADFETLYSHVRDGIRAEADRLCDNTRGLYVYPAPFLSLMMEGCVERGEDVSRGCIYNNYGFHGTGLSTAADSLASIAQYVYQEGRYTPQEMLEAMETDFAGREEMLHTLRYDAPKMGNDDERADSIACRLLEDFSLSLEGKHNDRGGIFRAGTGSAMYYLWHGELGATPDGRRANEGLAANYSPSLFTRCRGPVSIIKSFVKPDLAKVINGGPLTIELHDTLFRNQDSIDKVAGLIRSFILLGGHQMQINAVNRETMLDAQKHPENHRGLIVRVWGWSGYFVELDREYQDHIIRRMELAM